MIQLKITNLNEFNQALVKNAMILFHEQTDEFLQRCLDFLRKRYENLPYPIKVNGEDVSKVHPSEIANSLQIVNVGSNQKAIQIVSSNPDVEWSARRYAFLTDGNNNPFSELLLRIDSGSNI